jgi:phage terminase large subunit
MGSPNVLFPEKLKFLFKPKRYKPAMGGRAGAKSWNFARALLIHGTGQTYFKRPLRILCARETQKSIADSVHHLLANQIGLLGLDSFYRIQETSIKGANGTEFLFAGIRQQNIVNLKSFEDVDICWVEEAQVVTKRSWEVLIPTIRKNESEIWLSFNPELETDETYQRFVVNPPPDCEVVTVNYYDNPFLPDTIRKEIEHLKVADPDAFANIYEGHCKQAIEGAIYKQQIIQAEKENRFTSVPYDAVKPVDTFWDLGFGDSVAIWLVQTCGFEYHLIDFIEDSQQDIGFYLKKLQERPYVYGTHYLPHDARAKVLAAAGRTIEQQVSSGGRKVEIVPNASIEDGIAAARAIFNRCWFDKVKCADGIQALRHYRYAVDETLSVGDKQVFKKEPCHDWASHPADSFRYLAIAIKEPKQKRPPKPSEYGGSSTGWMG